MKQMVKKTTLTFFILLCFFNGAYAQTWSSMTSGTTNPLWGIWGSSASDVFAVGYMGTILHYDGSTWSAMTSGTTNQLMGIWGSSSSDVFAVGGVGTIRHYNGSSWSAMTSGTSADLADVWGSSGSDVFAVGAMGKILHYNGSSWSAMASGTTNALFGVWGSSASDVFAVGLSGTILNYNGTSWSPMTGGTTQYFYSVWGSSGTDVFAVAYSGSILHYDGSRWSAMTSGTTNALKSVWGSSVSDVFAVGSYGTIRHYNGSSWSAMTSGTTTKNLIGIWGSSGSDVFAVGEFGTILHYSGASPTTTTSVEVATTTTTTVVPTTTTDLYPIADGTHHFAYQFNPSYEVLYNEIQNGIYLNTSSGCSAGWCNSYHGIIEFDIASLSGKFQSGQMNAKLILTMKEVYPSGIEGPISSRSFCLYDMDDADETGVIGTGHSAGTAIETVTGAFLSPTTIEFNVTNALDHDLFNEGQTYFSGFLLTDEYMTLEDHSTTFWDHTSAEYAPKLIITSPTIIRLSSFTAEAQSKKVILEWLTESEIDTAGFNIYRTEEEDGQYIKINTVLIPARGSGTQGAAYEYIDTDVKNRTTYYYKLEDIDLNGKSTMHGPVSATPRLFFGIFGR